MLRLEELARDVVRRRHGAALQSSLTKLAEHLRCIDDGREKYAEHIRMAKEAFATNELEIDDRPIVSASPGPGASGAFVSAWVWVEAPQTQPSESLSMARAT